MKTLRAWRMRLAGFFHKSRRDQELDDELASHVQMLAEDYIRGGMAPELARRRAVLESGGLESAKEAYRDQRGLPLVEMLSQDLRYAARMLRKNPGFTIVAVVTLAFAIGANTSIFTVIHALLLRSLPVNKPGELVQLIRRSGSLAANFDFSYPEYQWFREEGRGLSGLFAAMGVNETDTLVGQGQVGAQPELVRGQGVSGNFFQVLGISAALGRTLNSNDDLAGNPLPIAVISDGFWRRHFAGEQVIGKTILFDDVPFTIVGVTPPGFFGFQPGENPDLWWPLQMIPQIDRDPTGRRLKEGYDSFRLVGRLGAGATRSGAEAELSVIYRRNQQNETGKQAHSASEQSAKVELLWAGTGWSSLRQQMDRPLAILMAAVGIVLLIACANVASLLLARAASRAREFSVRKALGATRRRLVRQSLTENLLLASLGGALGLLLAQGGTRMLLTFIQGQGNNLSFDLSPNLPVLLFTSGLCLLTGILLAVVPGLRTSDRDVASGLKASAGTLAGIASRSQWLQGLVIAQVALSLVLLVGAGLFIRTLQKLVQNTGAQINHVVQFNLAAAERPSPTRMNALTREILTRLEDSPGVQSASFYLFGLLSGSGFTQKVLSEGYAAGPTEDLQCKGVCAGPRLFETLGIQLLSGRDFNAQDTPAAGATNASARRVVVINQSMARRYFGDADPLGKRIYLQDQPEKKYEIVGVVRDSKYRSLREEPPPVFYLPFFQEPRNGPLSFVLRTSGDPRATITALRWIVGGVDKAIGVKNVRTMTEVVNASARQERMVAQLGTFFSASALALACLGLYGVLSFSVAQRTREIGLRLALGAQKWDVLSLVLGKGVKLVLLGSCVGSIATFITMRFVSSLLYGVSGTDPLTLAVVSLLLLLVATFASWLPARRAARVQPTEALRHE